MACVLPRCVAGRGGAAARRTCGSGLRAALGAPVLREGVQRRSHGDVHADRPRRVQLGRAREGGPPGWLTRRRTARSEAGGGDRHGSVCAITRAARDSCRSWGDLYPHRGGHGSCWRPCARCKTKGPASPRSLLPVARAGLGGHDRPLQRVRWVVIQRHPPNGTDDGLVAQGSRAMVQACRLVLRTRPLLI